MESGPLFGLSFPLQQVSSTRRLPPARDVRVLTCAVFCTNDQLQNSAHCPALLPVGSQN